MIPADLQTLVDALRAFGYAVTVDTAPRSPLGEWWIDIVGTNVRTAANWKQNVGFGVYTHRETYFGERPDVVTPNLIEAYMAIRDSMEVK